MPYYWDTEKFQTTGNGWKDESPSLQAYAERVEQWWWNGGKEEWKREREKIAREEDAFILKWARWKREWASSGTGRNFCGICGHITEVNNNRICFLCWLKQKKE